MTESVDGLPPTVRFIERDWLSANQILLFDDDAVTVVDTGYEKHAPMTAALVRAALDAHGPDTRLCRIINTHLHSDHCGGNARLQAEHECRTWVPAASLADVRAWDTAALTYAGTGQDCPRFVADGALAPGDGFEAGGLRWHCHAAPGHDPKSLIFHAPEAGLLISADALWRHGFGVIFPELVDASGFAEQAAILDLIESLAPRRVLPGHGPVFDRADLAIDEARARLAALRADPRRNCRGALRALVMFRMLALECVSRDTLQQVLANADIMAAAAATLGLSLHDGIDMTIDDLVRQRQLHDCGDGRIAVPGVVLDSPGSRQP
ncbi:MAG: MBL fold metallo-hydrolase [Burkholderiaceae bacterium]